jgi:hypothetical protein
VACGWLWLALLTAMQITVIEQLDPVNEVVYMVADNPPPPFSKLVAQRDFVIFRHAEVDRRKGVYMHVLRNGESDKCPPRVCVRRASSNYASAPLRRCAGPHFNLCPLFPQCAAFPPTWVGWAGAGRSCVWSCVRVAGAVHSR